MFNTGYNFVPGFNFNFWSIGELITYFRGMSGLMTSIVRVNGYNRFANSC